MFWALPIVVIFVLVGGGWVTTDDAGKVVEESRNIARGLCVATALMIVVRQRYPRSWFDSACELIRFGGRVPAYLALLTDRNPSTVDKQAVLLEIDYPAVRRDPNRWLPLFKWLLAFPHCVALVVLSVLAFLAVVADWFVVLLAERYPRSLFDFVVRVRR